MPQSSSSPSSTSTPCEAPPPWLLRGEAIALPLLGLSKGRLVVGAQLWVRYDSSPVGPYDEYAVALVRRVGKNWGPHVVEMAVSSPDSMRCGRANWGFPKVVRALKYLRRGRSVRFQDGGKRRAFRLSRASVPIPIWVPAWALQVLEGHPVRVPMALRGRARLCWSGRRLGVCLESFEFQVEAPVST